MLGMIAVVTAGEAGKVIRARKAADVAAEAAALYHILTCADDLTLSRAPLSALLLKRGTSMSHHHHHHASLLNSSIKQVNCVGGMARDTVSLCQIIGGAGGKRWMAATGRTSRRPGR